MKVLQISNYYYPNRGGIEQIAENIDKICQKNRIESSVLCFNSNAEGDGITCYKSETVTETINGTRVTRCGCFAKIASQSLSFTYRNCLKKLLISEKPDIVILHWPNPFAAFVLLSLLPKLKKESFKLIVYWHSDIVKQRFLSVFFLRLTNCLCKKASVIVSTSPTYILGSTFLKRYREKVSVIPNCICENRLSLNDRILSSALQIREKYSERIISFSVGRHIPYKGFSYLIKTSEYLNDNIIVIIGGHGPLSDKLKKDAAEKKNIVFTGKLSDEDLVAYFSACDMIAFPSITKNEAFGLSLAEGMYFGKPSVTYHIDGSGVNYVNIDGETGIECENRNVLSFASAMNRLAEETSLRRTLGNNAKKRVLSEFSFEKFEQNIMNLLQNM